MRAILNALPQQPASRAIEALSDELFFVVPVRNTCRAESTGEDLPGRTGVLQTTLRDLETSIGKPVSFEMPEPLGPRKRVQPWSLAGSWAGAETTKNASCSKPA